MPRQYAKVESIKDKMFGRKGNGETGREIAESFGLTKKSIELFVSRENRKERAIRNGYVPRSKRHPRQSATDPPKLVTGFVRFADSRKRRSLRF